MFLLAWYISRKINKQLQDYLTYSIFMQASIFMCKLYLTSDGW